MFDVFGFDNLVLFVGLGEFLATGVDEISEEMDVETFSNVFETVEVSDEESSNGSLSLVGELPLSGGEELGDLVTEFGLLDDLAESGVLVEEVDGGISVSSEHFIAVELVLRFSVLLEIEVLDTGDSDFLSILFELVLGEEGSSCLLVSSGLFLGSLLDLLEGSLLGLIEEFHQLDGLSVSCGELLSVGSLDESESHMFSLDLILLIDPAHEFCSLDDHVEMLLLPKIGDIDDSVSLQGLDSVLDAGEIGGVVAVASIRLNDHQRDLVGFSDEDALGSIINSNKSLLFALLDGSWDHVVVETFTHFLQADIQSLVEFLVLLSGEIADQFPGLQTFSISGLEFHDSVLTLFLENFVFIEFFLCLLIEGC